MMYVSAKYFNLYRFIKKFYKNNFGDPVTLKHCL